ncbi:copper-binding protein [Halomonas sp. M20]|uniref:copper-binding protein n=1 Tax=Halomonas sp. M20 TaxID=2763264 RepID=UPI001D0A60F8|nr:copper-binding protein [Halomonas sp. M20]
MTNAIRNMLTTAALSVAFIALPASADTNHDGQKHGSKMQQSAETQTAQGEGTVKAIDTAAQQITLSHGPIEALGWPGMTMPFNVAESASMEGLSLGDEVRFEVRKSGSDIAITEISQQ